MTEGKDEGTGQFLPGNDFWKARSSHGPKPKFANADDLWAACCEYFEWNTANPLWEAKLVSFQGQSKQENLPKLRAMTVAGLCLFIDISHDTWIEWRKSRPDLSEVIARVEAIIRQQKFEGASADLLNPNIIARDLGLADRQEHTGKDGGAIETKDVSDTEVARRLAFILEKGLRAKEGTDNG